MKINDTGIIVKSLKEIPVDDCFSTQQVSFQDAKGKWHIIGYEIKQYCLKDDIDPAHADTLPCYQGKCVWLGIKIKAGSQFIPLDRPQKPKQLQLPF